MLIRKISLRNFRNFKTCDIEFSCDPEKNFTIILGQNTYGKTTLVKAFVWCLYRENLFANRILLNEDVAENLEPGKEEIVKVELELEHKESSYKIITTETYKNSAGSIVINKKANTTLLKVDNNGSIPMNNEAADSEIESILRPELKEYFFFDGETNSIESISSKKNLTTAVKNILGLDKIETIKEYYDPGKSESVISNLRRELKLNDYDNLFESLNNELEEENERKERLEKEIADIEQETYNLSNQLKEKEAILDANEDVKDLQSSKTKIERTKSEAMETKEKSFETMIRSFNSSLSFLKVLFAESYKKYDMKNLLESSSFDKNSSYKGINEDAVDELVAAGQCICGAVITNGNDAYKHLMEAKQHMEPHDYGKYISDFISYEESNALMGESTLDDIIKEANKVCNAIEKIENCNKDYKRVCEKLEGRIDTGAIQKEIDTIRYQLGQKIGRLQTITERELSSCEKNIAELNMKINLSSEKNDENKFTNLCIEYATAIYNAATKKLEKAKTEIKEKLQEEVGKVFSSMYTGNRKIIIDDEFKATAKVEYSGGIEKDIDKSTGLGTVVNYSFVAGLMNLAKKSINDNDDVLKDENSTVESYPLVMDAPFSNTDDEHIKNICTSLPNFCDQIIMFVMQKDYNYALESIAHKVGKKYRLHKISETNAVLKEED